MKRAVHIEKPYRFDQAILSLKKEPLLDADLQQRRVRLPFLYGEDKHIITIEQTSEADDTVSFSIDGPEEKNANDAAVRFASEVLDFNTSFATMHTHFTNSDLAELFQTYQGTPLVRDVNAYYCLMKTLIHQQLNVAFARTLTERFIRLCGEQKDGVWFMPDIERVASFSYESLREQQFSMRKAEYVIDLSREIVNGTLNLEKVATLPDEEVVQELTAYRGVGVWTARSFLLFGLGRADLFPSADVGLQKALHPLLGADVRPTTQELEQRSPAWAPYRSYASVYLWKSIENS
ncbi:DNA-3-methyladenine glycosylase family protein [Aureibacillus halotolerans]|uniref:DNA-3-methyladenine glycosylase II n=1 Tax=Aureibacillus halotolerans TaxID=1508390 RepID=A0A4V3D4L9_9BACI|nr:DNA-3-methyladenine glycosylase [Aureibacillus halotolerans]TDQ36387.1 DNA-3-methyladenine glycosylase II [Aureibacillus halotolerans]